MKLDELQRLAEGATPGPWKAYDAAVRACDEIHSLIAFGYMRNIGPAERDAAYIAAMSPDTAKKLIAVAKVVEEAHALVQEFKTRWMALPPFAEKINRATREGMTMAHQPIMQAEERLRTALEELK